MGKRKREEEGVERRRRRKRKAGMKDFAAKYHRYFNRKR